jgi:two-component system chemotaxis response regulator CheB
VRRYDIVAIGASAGGLKALSTVLAALPAGFGAALVVVQHVDRRYPSRISEILGKRTALDVHEAREGDVIAPGAVYVAPPDHHLLVNKDGRLTLTQTELVHFVRPSADLLFESAAASFRERVIGVVLSGTGLDGAMGVRAISKMGGKVIVQDEESSEFPGMPHAAVQTGKADLVLPLGQIAAALEKLVGA